MILILVILHRQMLSTCSSMFIPRYRCTYYILRQDRAAYEYVTNIVLPMAVYMDLVITNTHILGAKFDRLRENFKRKVKLRRMWEKKNDHLHDGFMLSYEQFHRGACYTG